MNNKILPVTYIRPSTIIEGVVNASRKEPVVKASTYIPSLPKVTMPAKSEAPVYFAPFAPAGKAVAAVTEDAGKILNFFG